MFSAFSFERAGASFKILVTFFIVLVGIGYVFGLINIYNNVGLSYTGIVVHYRGSETEMTVPPDFAFAKLISEHHVHLFAMSMLFFLVGMLFVLTDLPEKVKVPIILCPFIGMLVDFSSLWLVVFSSPLFGWLSLVFGGLMGVSFFFILGRPLYEMWVIPVLKKSMGETLPWYLS